MSGSWVRVSKRILDQLKKLNSTKDRDRLELVRSMRFALKALEMSLAGWKGWVSNPDIMTQFTKKEIEEMSKKLSDFTRTFIKYDIEMTKLGSEKGLKEEKRVKKEKKEKERTPYVA